MIYSLYVKEHKITGLKYLGQTGRNPDNYKGSGKDWRKHLKECGNDHSTYVIVTSESKKEIGNIGREYSVIWNVVQSKEWLNRIPETGGGFGLPGPRGLMSEENKAKLRGSHGGPLRRPRSEEHKHKLRMPRKPYKKKSIIFEYTCPHCGKIGKGEGMYRWHFDNCRVKI